MLIITLSGFDKVVPCCCNCFINLRQIWLRCNSHSTGMFCVAELDGCGKSSDSVATTIQGCHGCQSRALVSENGRRACQTPFKPQAGISFSNSLHSRAMCHHSVWECVRVQRSSQDDLYYSLYLDNGPVPFFPSDLWCTSRAALREQSVQRLHKKHWPLTPQWGHFPTSQWTCDNIRVTITPDVLQAFCPWLSLYL